MPFVSVVTTDARLMASRGGADEDVAFEDAPMGEALVEASDERDPDTPGVGLTPAPPLVRFCEHLTKSACRVARGAPTACAELHFRPIRYPWTNSDVHCHFLDACKFRGTCRYVHWELDVDDGEIPSRPDPPPFVYSHLAAARVPERLRAIPDPQWIRADLKRFDLCLLGDFAVVLVDPPWNIGIDLPYDTMSDADMRNLGVEALQTEGYLFLWVTGRAMELGRTCMAQWNYRRVAELVWIKVNQMQNIIRTGRTGHFLNHSKEHMLIGVKGEPSFPRAPGARPDCDVLVSEVRETSRKPTEVYGIAERLAPGARKLELFARQHNVGQPGWVAIGNQLDDSRVVDESMASRVREAYPTMRL